MRKLSRKWFERGSVTLARELLGAAIIHDGVGGMIVETEAYARDPASHAFRITPRSAIMQDTYGVFYVYFTYGMHHCVNVTTDKHDAGAVLIRAVEPLWGIPVMQKRRGKKEVIDLTSGPGKVCQALGITRVLNGSPVNQEMSLYQYRTIPDTDVISATRVGIREAKDLPWRFYIKGNPYVSRP